jgi:DNA-binding SARP family transcriptional activator
MHGLSSAASDGPGGHRLEFRVLGPVQVATAAGTVELASGKQVALLACLLVARGEVVSRDRLIDALWGEQPPAAAVNALQVHVHGLRRRLGPERIELDGPGYRLCLASGELDLERFELLVARGRSELSRGEAGPGRVELPRGARAVARAGL